MVEGIVEIALSTSLFTQTSLKPLIGPLLLLLLVLLLLLLPLGLILLLLLLLMAALVTDGLGVFAPDTPLLTWLTEAGVVVPLQIVVELVVMPLLPLLLLPPAPVEEPGAVDEVVSPLACAVPLTVGAPDVRAPPVLLALLGRPPLLSDRNLLGGWGLSVGMVGSMLDEAKG